MPPRRRSRRRAFPRAVFDRLVREIACDMITDLNGWGNEPLRWEPRAVDAIQEVAEQFVLALFEDARLCAGHAGRSRVNVEDIQLVRRLRGWRRAS